jgi:hypothetical protein
MLCSHHANSRNQSTKGAPPASFNCKFCQFLNQDGYTSGCAQHSTRTQRQIDQGELRANLKPGVHEIWSRAIDALGRTQPLDGSIFWNPNGYEWTGVFKVEVTVN